MFQFTELNAFASVTGKSNSRGSRVSALAEVSGFGSWGFGSRVAGKLSTIVNENLSNITENSSPISGHPLLTKEATSMCFKELLATKQKAHSC